VENAGGEIEISEATLPVQPIPCLVFSLGEKSGRPGRGSWYSCRIESRTLSAAFVDVRAMLDCDQTEINAAAGMIPHDGVPSGKNRSRSSLGSKKAGDEFG